MKRLTILILLCLYMTGCSTFHSISKEESLAFMASERAYLDKILEIQKENMVPKPLVQFANPADPKGVPIIIYQQPIPIDFSKIPQLQQKRPSEWAAVANNFMSVAGMVGGIYVGGKAIENIADAVSNNSGHNVMNSYNQANPVSGYNQANQANPISGYNQANQANPVSGYNQANQANPTSTTTTTTTATNDSHNQANPVMSNSNNPIDNHSMYSTNY